MFSFGIKLRRFMLIPAIVLFSPIGTNAQTLTNSGPSVGAEGESKPLKNSLHADIEVNWEKPVSRSAPYLFGTNNSVIVNPKEASDEPLELSLRAMAIPFLRLTNRELSRVWTDEKTKTWNAAKIKAAYDAPYLQHSLILQNIPGWPVWMKQEQGRLDPSEYDRYAAFCADLVRIINAEQGRRVVFWEPLGEMDASYFKENRQEALWNLYNRAAAAMKQTDPTIKVGGGPFTLEDPAKIESFLNACGSNLDFVSWRFYPESEAPLPPGRLMEETPQAAKQAAMLRDLIRKALPGRIVPLVLDEFRMNRSGTPDDERQGTIVGAVWTASMLKHLADASVDMAASWNLKDNAVGLVDLQNRAHPVATVYAWENQHLTGEVMETASNEPMIEAMAARKADRSRHLLLINKAEKPAEVKLNMQGKNLSGPGGIRAERLDEKGYHGERMTAQEMEKSVFTLPPYSLLLLHLQK